ncbi:MAG: replicative DNA helicase, partial [Rhodospirillaceae bacterium]|nr:replicative DNA helicase [Rhodospirillaceae bacterium]
ALEQVFAAGELFDALADFSASVDRVESETGVPIRERLRLFLHHSLVHDPALRNRRGESFVVAEDGRTIYDRHLRRALIAIAQDVADRAYDYDLDVDAIKQIELAEEGLFDLATSGEYGEGFKTFQASLTDAVEIALAAYKSDGHVTGVSSGFADLDGMLGGMHQGELLVLAGRPSMGKTALVTNMAFAAAKAYREEVADDGTKRQVDGAVVGFFSLEMSAEELATRILAEEARISSAKIRKGEMNQEDFDRLVQASQRLAAAPFFIDDTAALSVSAMRTRARRLKRQHGLSLIVVDYLQLLRPPTEHRNENRVQEIAAITRALKALAKELEVPVIALSQLSRAVEQREDKRPQLSDLRESGTIEQDSDVVMFVYRPEYYLERQQPDIGSDKHMEWQESMDRVHNLAEVIVAKQRNGPIGTVKLYFRKEFTRFEPYLSDDRAPEPL